MSSNLDEATVAAIERACARLLLRSIRAFDERDWPVYASLFTDDGVFIRANQPDEPLAGREAIRAALAARPATRLTRHLCTNIEIDVLDAEHARGSCYLVLYVEAGQRVGEYHDTFERTAEGWRISRREGRLIFRTTG